MIKQLPVRQQNLALTEALNADAAAAPAAADGAPAADGAAAPAAAADLDGAAAAMPPVPPAADVDPAAPPRPDADGEVSDARADFEGFLWLSNSHSQIFYWALAGKHFELKQYGMWWASVAEEEWPLDEKERREIRKDFDASADGLGDRRQEVVFIGVKMDKAAITALLDACLLTDTEMDSYKQHWNRGDDA